MILILTAEHTKLKYGTIKYQNNYYYSENNRTYIYLKLTKQKKISQNTQR